MPAKSEGVRNILSLVVQLFLSAPTTSHLFKDKTHLCKPTGHQERSGHSDCRGLWAFTECRPTLRLKSRLQRAGDSFKMDTVDNVWLRKVKFPGGSQNVWKWIWTFVFKIFGLLVETHFTCFLKLKRKTKSLNIQFSAPVKFFVWSTT